MNTNWHTVVAGGQTADLIEKYIEQTVNFQRVYREVRALIKVDFIPKIKDLKK